MTSPTTSTATTIVIRDIESLEEMHEVEQLQREIWGVEDLEIYPALALKPQQEVGATRSPVHCYCTRHARVM